MYEYPFFYMQMLANALDEEVGEAQRREILAGAEELTSKTSKPKRIQILREVMARMEAHPDRAAMLRARAACACKPPAFLKDAKKMLAQSPNLPAFLEAAQQVNFIGKSLRYENGPEGERILGEFGFRRCVCGKVSAAKEPLAMMWCECCRGHVLWMWQNILERPILVDLTTSAITGSDECRFVVTWD